MTQLENENTKEDTSEFEERAEQTRFHQQMKFLLEMDKSKEVFRQNYLASGSRKENDAEHSWHLAMMCLLLQEYSREKLDVLRTLTMVLFHDVIEIDAGDTYAYDSESGKTKEKRERQAAVRLYGMLPEDQGNYLREIWEEFEAGETPEARFAHTLDRVQPLMLNDASSGRSWEEHGIHAEQVYQRNARTQEGSEELWNYAKEIIERNKMAGRLL